MGLENILKYFNGKVCGNQYLFYWRNEKFIATLDFDGGVDYGWRKLIRIRQAYDMYSNVFELNKGGLNLSDKKVKYWSEEKDRFIIVTDFSDITEEIVNWLDFMLGD